MNKQLTKFRSIDNGFSPDCVAPKLQPRLSNEKWQISTLFNQVQPRLSHPNLRDVYLSIDRAYVNFIASAA